MKQTMKRTGIYIVLSYYFIRIRNTLFQPLKDIPKPDFNNVYDSTML